MALSIGTIVTILFILYFYQTLWDQNMGMIILLPMILAPLINGGIFIFIWAVGESIGREVWPRKFITLDLIRNGAVQQDVVAHRLSLSVATLRRRLEQEGTNFRELISAHYVEEATQLLQKGHSVSHVSDVLNYSGTKSYSSVVDVNLSGTQRSHPGIKTSANTAKVAPDARKIPS